MTHSDLPAPEFIYKVVTGDLFARAAADGVVDAASFARVWEETRADAADAIAFAQSSPEPDPATLTKNVYTV